MTRVAVVATVRHPLRAPFAGGLEAITWHLVRGLRQRRVDVTLVARAGTDPALDVEWVAPAACHVSDVARRDPAMVPAEQVQEHFAYLGALRELAARRDISVVHNNALHYLPLAMADLIAAPMVTSFHTPPTPWLEPAVRMIDHRRMLFTAVSGATADAWAGCADARVIPNGVDLDAWRTGPGGGGLVWSGRIVPEKAPHVAIAIARAAGRPLRLAGPVADPGYFERRIRPLLGGGISYAGHLPHASLVDLIGHSAAALVTPVWDEPYGLVAAEALACGTPVLALARGGLPEVVGPDCSRLVVAEDEAEAIARGAELVGAVSSLSRRAARAHAVRHCSLDRMIDAYLAVYDEAAALPVSLGQSA